MTSSAWPEWPLSSLYDETRLPLITFGGSLPIYGEFHVLALALL